MSFLQSDTMVSTTGAGANKSKRRRTGLRIRNTLKEEDDLDFGNSNSNSNSNTQQNQQNQQNTQIEVLQDEKQSHHNTHQNQTRHSSAFLSGSLNVPEFVPSGSGSQSYNNSGQNHNSGSGRLYIPNETPNQTRVVTVLKKKSAAETSKDLDLALLQIKHMEEMNQMLKSENKSLLDRNNALEISLKQERDRHLRDVSTKFNALGNQYESLLRRFVHSHTELSDVQSGMMNKIIHNPQQIIPPTQTIPATTTQTAATATTPTNQSLRNRNTSLSSQPSQSPYVQQNPYTQTSITTTTSTIPYSQSLQQQAQTNTNNWLDPIPIISTSTSATLDTSTNVLLTKTYRSISQLSNGAKSLQELQVYFSKFKQNLSLARERLDKIEPIWESWCAITKECPEWKSLIVDIDYTMLAMFNEEYTRLTAGLKQPSMKQQQQPHPQINTSLNLVKPSSENTSLVIHGSSRYA